MSCAVEWGTLLSKVVDGECTPEERQLVESHVASCAACASSLELFRHNEKVLESALAGEAFGDLVVDEVMAEIRRLETPPVVAPEVRSSRWRDRVRRFWPAAAAAAAILLSVGFAFAMRAEVAKLGQQVQRQQELNDVLAAQWIESMREEADTRRGGYAIVLPTKSVEVRGTFPDRESLTFFEIQRSQDDGKSWTTLAKELKEPAFEDRTLQEGISYVYRFIGFRKDGSKVEAAPIGARLPALGGLDDRTSLRITFIGATTDKATFEIQRYVDGEAKHRLFAVGTGETLGDVVDGVDYSTNLVLQKIIKADEVLAPGERAITRPSKLAKLRAVGAGPKDLTLDLWRGSDKLVPIPAK